MSGSTSFEWNGNAAVEKVQLAGSFTQWKPVEMEKNSAAADEKWALKLDLSPGEYEFKFGRMTTVHVAYPTSLIPTELMVSF